MCARSSPVGHCARIVQEPAPSRPIARGMAAPGLLAHIMVAKYADHCPLYRQQGIYAREGVELERATMADGSARRHACSIRWSTRSAATCWRRRRCTPTTPRCRCSIPGAARPRPDGCGLTCAMIGRRPAAIRRRCGSATRPIAKASIRKRTCAVPRHPAGRRLRRIRAALRGRADPGSGLLGARAAQVLRHSTWSIARRSRPRRCERIGALYAIETRHPGPSAGRSGPVRQARAGPLLEALQAWLEATLAQVSTKSELAGAIGYALTRWTALTRYRDDGRIEIDNNAAERALRALVARSAQLPLRRLGRRRRTCRQIYSLIGTAKLNGLDPEAVPARRARAHRRPSDQPHRRVAAVACGAGGTSRAPARLTMAVARKAPLRAVKAATPIYQLRIELLDVKPVDLATHPGAGRDQIGPAAWRIAVDDGVGRRPPARVHHRP